jgi:16S rRNA (guanine527-N7)-methyltransferase
MNDAPVPDWLNVSRETLAALQAFADEVRRWNPAINLVSKNSLPDIWQRHLLDSAQLYPLGGNGLWLDMGSGGGFPGVVMGIMGAQNMVMIESDQRKSTFLREVSRKLGLQNQIITARLEDVPAMQAQTITARALAPLTDLIGLAQRHIAPQGRAIFPKGRGFQAEIDQAQQDWVFNCQVIASKTDSEAAILVVSAIEKR